MPKDDSRFADTVNIDRWRRRRIVLAGAAFTIGIVVLLVGSHREQRCVTP